MLNKDVPMRFLEVFSQRVLARRRELGMMQRELAEAIGSTSHVVCRLENPRYAICPSFGTLVKISEALQTTPDYLLGFDHGPAGEPHDLNGEYVIVVCQESVVYSGELVAIGPDRRVDLKHSRDILVWSCAESTLLPGVAQFGIDHAKSKVGPTKAKNVILDACEVFSTTDKAAESIRNAPVYWGDWPAI